MNTTAGPAREMVRPDPMNNPVPIAPPIAISWMCRLLRPLLGSKCVCGGDTAVELFVMESEGTPGRAPNRSGACARVSGTAEARNGR
ncbi:hypothetical protein GCM10007061_04820 [Kocuria marina]|nr:hypothetical protein GCM10007061_04820 [Kocuria marina]